MKEKWIFWKKKSLFLLLKFYFCQCLQCWMGMFHRKLTRMKWHFGVSIVDDHRWVFHFAAMINDDELAVHRPRMINRTIFQCERIEVVHIHGAQLVNFSIGIHYHSTIQNVRQHRIMNVMCLDWCWKCDLLQNATCIKWWTQAKNRQP